MYTSYVYYFAYILTLFKIIMFKEKYLLGFIILVRLIFEIRSSYYKLNVETFFSILILILELIKQANNTPIRGWLTELPIKFRKSNDLLSEKNH